MLSWLVTICYWVQCYIFLCSFFSVSSCHSCLSFTLTLPCPPLFLYPFPFPFPFAAGCRCISPHLDNACHAVHCLHLGPMSFFACLTVQLIDLCLNLIHNFMQLVRGSFSRSPLVRNHRVRIACSHVLISLHFITFYLISSHLINLHISYPIRFQRDGFYSHLSVFLYAGSVLFSSSLRVVSCFVHSL